MRSIFILLFGFLSISSPMSAQLPQTHAYATYPGLPALTDSALQARWGVPAWHGSGVSGEAKVPVQHSIYRLADLSEPVDVFSRAGEVLRIDIDYPAIPDVPALLQALGEPALRLDYHFDVIVMAGLRWAYPARGIAFDLNDDYSVVISVCLFVPTSPEAYRAEVHTSEPIREFPWQED
jgi:hypothetical protein